MSKKSFFYLILIVVIIIVAGSFIYYLSQPKKIPKKIKGEKPIALLPVGNTCSSPSDCKSGYCVDGYCCDSSCDDKICQVCSEYSTNGAGDCGYVKFSSEDPDNECNEGTGSSDGCKSGHCSGSDYSCRVITRGEGNCPSCQGCSDGDIACENTYPQGSKDTTGPNTCTKTHYRCDGSGKCTAPTRDQAPPTPELISPYSNAKHVPTKPRLICSEVTDPQGDTVIYVFSLDDNRDFSSPIINELSLTQNVLKIGSDWEGSFSSGTTYYWKVHAHDGEHASGWSSMGSFEVDGSTNYFDDIKVGVKDTLWSGHTDEEVRNAVYSAFGDVNNVFCTINNLPFWYEVSTIYKFTNTAISEVGSYYNHDHDLVVLYSNEEVQGGYYSENYYVISNTYCKGIESIMNTDGLIHELGHYRGCPDLFILEVPSGQNAVATSESHTPSTSDQYIMDYPYGIRTFCDYSKNIISTIGSSTRAQDSDKRYRDSRRYFAPKENFILVRDNNNPISGADVKVYCNTPYQELDGDSALTSCIDSSIDTHGTTDSSGYFLFTQKNGNQLDLEFDIVFVKVEYEGATEYAWIEDIDVGGLYWGYKKEPILVRDGESFDIYYTSNR